MGLLSPDNRSSSRLNRLAKSSHQRQAFPNREHRGRPKKSESLTVQHRPETTWNLNTKTKRTKDTEPTPTMADPPRSGPALASGNRKQPGFGCGANDIGKRKVTQPSDDASRYRWSAKAGAKKALVRDTELDNCKKDRQP